VVNIEDTTPVNDVITVIQSKRILEFLDSQENTAKVTPPKMYQLIERIINDSKLSTAASKTDDSFSKLFEKHRIEQNINLVMNKLESANINEQFIESLVHSSINLSETPNFYQKIIKRAITQGVVPTKKAQEVEGETATPPVEEAKDENVVSPTQYLTALGAHKTFLGNLTVAQQ
jgi:chorismate mutase